LIAYSYNNFTKKRYIFKPFHVLVGVNVEDRDQLKGKTLELLKSINTLDDLEEHKEEVLALIEEFIKFGVQILKTFFESSASMSSEEKQKELAKFQDDNFLMGEEITGELDRISELPGADEFMENIQGEMEQRIAPHLEEFAEQMAKLMGEFMGDLMGGMMEGLGDVMESMGDMTQLDNVEGLEDEIDVSKIEPLQIVKTIQSLDDFKDKKDALFSSIENSLRSDLELAKKLSNISGPREEIKKKAAIIEKRQSFIVDEIEKEFERIDSYPGVTEYAETVMPEMLNRTQPIAVELKYYINTLQQDVSSTEQEFISEPEEREELEQLTFFYYINSLEDLKRDKNIIFNSLKETLESDLDELNDVKGILADDFPYDSVRDQLQRIEKRHQVIDVELQREFNRLKALPDAEEYVTNIHNELMDQFKDKVMELHELLEELKKD
jgi:hypothetical protein